MGKQRSPREIVVLARRHIERIQVWTSGFDVARFQSAEAEMVRYACERAFIALGEAVKDLSAEVDLTALHPSGPWAQSIRFRHFLTHDYDDGALPPLVWDTRQLDLPELDAALVVVAQALGDRSSL